MRRRLIDLGAPSNRTHVIPLIATWTPTGSRPRSPMTSLLAC